MKKRHSIPLSLGVLLLCGALIADSVLAPPSRVEVEVAAWEAKMMPIEPLEQRAPRPNFLVILADDLGYSDLGLYGSEIPTPNIDSLAHGGVVFNHFHASPTCAPSRAMLLTGQLPHRVNVGSAVTTPTLPWRKPNPSYKGELSKDAITIAEALREAGYSTFISGKWHLGLEPASDPSQHGFDRSFVLLEGGASHFGDQLGVAFAFKEASYREHGQSISLPADFFSTNTYTDKAIEYIEASRQNGEPFFGFVAYTAPHWPLQAPDAWLDRFKGHYSGGYAPTLEARLRNAEKQGMDVDWEAGQAKLEALSAAWDRLEPSQQANAARRMEIYAAMIAQMDERIGELLDYLETTGQRENTVVIFLSDNGADFTFPEVMPMNRRWVENTFDNRVENFGRPRSFVSVGAEWASVSSGPLRYFKATAHEGGTRVPAIISWPAGLDGAGSRTNELVTIMDIYPTFAQLAGASQHAHKVYGRPLRAVTGDSASPNQPTLVFETSGAISVRKGHFKLVHTPSYAGVSQWSLHDMRTDPGERLDLSTEHPDVMEELSAIWTSYADAYAVHNMPERFWEFLLTSRPEDLTMSSLRD